MEPSWNLHGTSMESPWSPGNHVFPLVLERPPGNSRELRVPELGVPQEHHAPRELQETQSSRTRSSLRTPSFQGTRSSRTRETWISSSHRKLGSSGTSKDLDGLDRCGPGALSQCWLPTRGQAMIQDVAIQGLIRNVRSFLNF